MRAQAQGLSSAANRDGSATRGSVFGRILSAIRASSLGSDGSGAPSHRARLTVLALAIAAFALLAFAPLSQAKVVTGGFGTSGTEGGQFGTALGIAVNNSGNGVARGTTYVVDSQNRVQRFSPAGVFERAWGQDVIATTVNERQLVTVVAGSGTYRLTFNGQQTIDIPYNANAALLTSALVALPTVGAGNVAVTGTPGSGFTVTFQGALAGANQPALTATTVLLGGTATVSTIAEGADSATTGGSGTGFEICRVATQCKAGSTSGTTNNAGQLRTPQGIAVSATTGDVYVTESGNRRVSEFTADGTFVRAWGWDVDGTVAGTGFEVCPAANSCKQGTAGAGAGQFGGSLGYPTVDSSNNVWVADTRNDRIQAFDSSGNWIKMLGGDVITNGATGTGTLDLNSTTVSSLTTTSKFFEVGQTVTSSGGSIPAGTTIVSCAPAATSSGICLSPTRLVLSQRPTANGVETITAAPGAGNSTENERQVISVIPGTGWGKFSLNFMGRETGAAGTGTLITDASLGDVATTDGAFAVGMEVNSNFGAMPPGQTITAIDTLARTMGVSSRVNVDQGSNLKLIGRDIPVGASAATVQARLEGLSTIGAGNVSVTGPDGGPWTVEFIGRFANADVPIISETDLSGTQISLATDVTSHNPFEVCSVPADCRTGALGVGSGQFGGNSFGGTAPTSLSFDSSGNLYAIDGASGGTSRSSEINSRIQKFNAALTSASDFGAATFSAYTTSLPEAMAAVQGGTRLEFAVNNNVTGGGERQILQLDPADASVRDTSLVGSRLNGAINGLAANDSTSALYATTGAASSPRRILALGTSAPAAPVPVMSPVTAKTDTTAILAGTIDPSGSFVSCSFEYSSDQLLWRSVSVPGCDSLASSGAQAVSANLSGLVPNTKYFVRLVASRPLSPGSSTTSGTTAFDTDSIPPAVSNVGAVEVADTSARLVGTIDPKHSATGYHFEYGTTPALGSSTTPVDIGAGGAPLIVSQVVEGLRASTTYYFRLVATNDFGTASSNSKTLLTRSGPVLPDDRAYEMVSPVDKNGGGALSGGQAGWSVAYDGEAVGFCTTSMFGDPSSPLTYIFDACAHYASQRGIDGWQTRSVVPPVCIFPYRGGHSLLWYSRNVDYLAMSRPEPECPTAPLDPAAQFGRNMYREDLTSTPSTFDLLGPQSGLIAQTLMRYAGSSYDFSHVVYSSPEQETSDAPAGDFDKLYDWDNGTLKLVSIDPSGTPFATASSAAGTGLTGGVFGNNSDQEGPADPDNGVSSNGERIFFQNAAELLFPGSGLFGGADIYMREGGTDTYRVTQSECTVDCPPSGGLFDFDFDPKTLRYATPDGSRAFFTTPRKLADDDVNASGDDLYMYTHSADPGRHLTTLSVDSEGADGTNADVLGVVGGSDNGDTIYFVAKGQLVVGGPTADGAKLYRWSWNGGDPRLDYLATLDLGSVGIGGDDGDSKLWLGGTGSPRSVTPDGQYLLVLTSAALDPVADTDSDRDFYRWDARGGWLCVSCQEPGVASAGDAEGRRRGRTSDGRRWNGISDDGQRIFFGTPDALVPEDINGEVSCPPGGTSSNGEPASNVPSCTDVYEWHNGKISLISTGTSSGPSYLMGASHDGHDVFFYSEDKLVGWDTDIVGDIYDARIGGGFPEPPVAGAPCDLNSGACEGAPSTAPTNTGAATRAFEGPGNPRGADNNTCGRLNKKAQRKLVAAKKAARKGQAKRARALRKQAKNFKHRAKRCNRRQGR